MRVTVTLATAACLAAWSAAARGSPAVTWSAPEGSECPDAAAFVARVEAHLGGPVPEELTATATARPRPPGWVVDIETRTPDATGERTIEGATCAEVFEAAALVVAMAVPVPRRAPPPQPSRKEEGVPAPVPSPPPSPSPTPPPSAPPPVHVAARATLGSNLGMLPGTEPGFAVDLSVSRGRLRGEVGASAWLERSRSVDTDDGVRGADLSARAAILRACYRTLGPVWTCAAGELGAMRGVGFGSTEMDFDRSSTWLAAGLTGIVPFNITESLSLVVTADALAPIRRPRFLHDGPVEVHQPAVVVGRVWAGASVRFR